MSEPKYKLPPRLYAEGLISIELFSLEAPLYVSETIRVEALKYMGYDIEHVKHPMNGCVGVDYCKENIPLFSMTITPGSTISTWAHEAVHLADLLMDSRGVPTDVSNTEVRAYLTGYIVEQIAFIMDKYYEREAKKKLKAQARAKTLEPVH
jgi:hypothetical protein